MSNQIQSSKLKIWNLDFSHSFGIGIWALGFLTKTRMVEEKDQLLTAITKAKEALRRAGWIWQNELLPRNPKSGDVTHFATLREELEKAIKRVEDALAKSEKEAVSPLQNNLQLLEQTEGALNQFLSQIREKTSPVLPKPSEKEKPSGPEPSYLE